MRFFTPRLVFAMLILGLWSLARGGLHPVDAGDDGVSGGWKVTIFQEDGSQLPAWLVVLQHKGGKLVGTVEPLHQVAATSLEGAAVAGDLLYFRLKMAKGGQVFAFEGKLPKAGGKKIFGSLARNTMMIPAILERTPAQTKFELERDLVLRTPNDPHVFGAVFDLIAQANQHKAPAKEVQEWVETALRGADNFGPRWQLEMGQQLVDALLAKEGYATVAAETARKTLSVMDAKAPTEMRLQMLSALGSAFQKAGQPQQAKEVEARVDRMEVQAYDAYAAQARGFKAPKFAGRKNKSNRNVLVELFTGAQCPPCVGADMAFDALPRSYDKGEVVLLQYHLHVPGPDALTNAASEARANYYGDEKVRGTPTVLFNGKVAPVGGGSLEDAEDVYKDYRKVADQILESATPSQVQLQTSASRKGGKVYIKTKVVDLAKPGDKIKLRVALVEDWARYKGRNGIGYYHQVVRAFPSGVQGTALLKKDSQHSAVVDLEEVRKSLTKYLDKAGKEEPFLDSQRPMRLRNLNVVAFVQNDATREVLQAVQAAVREE